MMPPALRTASAIFLAVAPAVSTLEQIYDATPQDIAGATVLDSLSKS